MACERYKAHRLAYIEPSNCDRTLVTPQRKESSVRIRNWQPKAGKPPASHPNNIHCQRTYIIGAIADHRRLGNACYIAKSSVVARKKQTRAG